VVEQTNQRVGNLRANLIVSLRSSAAGDRRGREPRIPVKLSGTLKCDGAALPGTVADISHTGLLFRASVSDEPARERGTVTIEIEKIGSISGSVIAKSAAGIHGGRAWARRERSANICCKPMIAKWAMAS
jgi:PilZ domain